MKLLKTVFGHLERDSAKVSMTKNELRVLIQSNPCYASQAIAMYYEDQRDFDPDRKWQEKFEAYNSCRYIDYGNTHWEMNKKNNGI